MNKANVIVSYGVRLVTTDDRSAVQTLEAKEAVEVELDGGRGARLDPADPRAEGLARVLEGIGRQHLPVYLELAPETETIERLLIPYVTQIIGLGRSAEGALEVEIAMSHARHRLTADQPDFAELEKRLRSALESGDRVILTEDDDHRIIDVRPFAPPPEAVLPPLPPEPTPPAPKPPGWLELIWKKLWYWPWWPWWWFGCVSAAKAQQVFDAMSARSCDPLTVPPPCIPFLYPDDGCWGRAHEMGRLMIDMGLSPKKVWIQGSLTAATRNHPSCAVHWGWHVAPTLCVRWWWFLSRTRVIDPSLFTEPVSKATWKGAQGDANATLTDSDASIFYLWGNVTDPTYTQTNQVLATYRLMLQARAVQIGPPPYAACP